jgi:hypothetical protein
MSDSADDKLSPELGPVVSRLRAERLESSPVELDELKRRVLDRTTRQRRLTGGSMKSRMATVLTLFALVGGSGGALAVAGNSGGAASKHANSAQSQYSPGKHRVTCRKGFHKVGNRCVRNKTVIKHKPTPKRLTGPAFTG